MFVSDLIPISVATLSPDATVGTDLFCRVESTDEVKLYRGGDYPLKPSDIEQLRTRGVNQLFIAPESREAYQDYLRELTSNDEIDVDVAARTTALNEVVLSVLQGTFDGRDSGQAVDVATELGGMAADVVTRDDFAAVDLFKVLNHDYATFTHSANVAYYAGMLASELGHDRDTVQKIITGGLVHDLGKLQIPDSILCKPGRLTDEEFDAIRMHPITGFRQLAHRDDLTAGQLMMVYQHHERVDGTGYPVGVDEHEIHPWAKICAVVDVYEAVTSQRPYRKPMPRTRALEILQKDIGTAFDPEAVQCWTSIIQSTTPK
ncbi:MAG: HD domain-containing phosphohydrolase [Planctomycetota bacterium]